MELLVFAIAVVFFLWLRARLSVENPGGTQQCMETAAAQSDVAGRCRTCWKITSATAPMQYLPMIGSIGLFVLFCNLISVVPGLASPTAEVSVPLGCAIVVFRLLQLVRAAKAWAAALRKAFHGAECWRFRR